MLELATNFLFLKVQNAPLLVYLGLIGIWLMFLGAGAASIFSRSDRSIIWKSIWLMLVVGLPWLGLFLYSLSCAFQADFAFLKPFGVRAPLRLDR